MNLEQSLLDSVWSRHAHCGDCGSCSQEPSLGGCTALKGADCPWFQEELAAFIEETFDPDEWEFLTRYNSEDAEGLFLAAYKTEFSYSDETAQAMLDCYRQARALKEQP